MKDETLAIMRAGNRRLGRARRVVAEFLGEHPGPVTAEDIIASLPEVHSSSVYRALVVLEELGYVRHVHLAHGAALYELTNRASGIRHVVCEVCGHTIEVPARLLAPLRRRLERDYGMVLDSSHFALTGRCTGCQRPDPARG